jgi:hypothetical protein
MPSLVMGKFFSTPKTQNPDLARYRGRICILITPSKWHGVHTFAILEPASRAWKK